MPDFICSRCGEKLPESAFSKANANTVRGVCRECDKLRRRQQEVRQLLVCGITRVAKPFRTPRHRPKAKLYDDVPVIRELISSGLSDYAIARKFDVCATTIRDIRIGNSWKRCL